MGSWYSGGFCTALRREEMTLIELAGTLASLVHLADPQEETPSFAHTIAGRMKMNRNQGAKVRIPCTGKTKGSGINAGEWMERRVLDLSTCGQTSGYLYTKRKGRWSYLADYLEDLFWPLQELQSCSNKNIPSLCDIREECGIWRSLARAATTHAINMGVDECLIHLINRWHKETQGPAKKGPIIDCWLN
jgi:hypothetical protein